MCSIPLLFITNIDKICKLASTIEQEKLSDQLRELLLADDQALISTSEEHLQQ